MAQVDERLCSPPPVEELKRRWAKVRTHMRDAKIDALIIPGQHSFSGGGGYFRWFTGTASPTSYSQVAIFPVDGQITLVHHGDLGGEASHDGNYPGHPGVVKRFTTAAFPTAYYCGPFEAEIIGREVKKAGYRTVGLIGANSAYYGFVSRLKELLAGVSIVDPTDAIDRIKAIKTEFDIAGIRRTAAMQDEIVRKAREYVKPGAKDSEVLAYGHYVGALLGSEQGYMLGSSAPPDQPAMVRLRPFQGRTMQKGDLFAFQCENSGPDGYYVHTARIFSLGKPPQKFVDAFGAAVEAQKFTLSLLKPGAKCKDVFAEYNAYVKARGYAEEKRLHCHGQGYETVERPLIRHDETMEIAGNMNIGIHPGLMKDGMFSTLSDNFLICGDGRTERLHQTPQEIIEV